MRYCGIAGLPYKRPHAGEGKKKSKQGKDARCLSEYEQFKEADAPGEIKGRLSVVNDLALCSYIFHALNSEPHLKADILSSRVWLVEAATLKVTP
jgi:hypothetical protein